LQFLLPITGIGQKVSNVYCGWLVNKLMFYINTPDGSTSHIDALQYEWCHWHAKCSALFTCVQFFLVDI